MKYGKITNINIKSQEFPMSIAENVLQSLKQKYAWDFEIENHKVSNLFFDAGGMISLDLPPIMLYGKTCNLKFYPHHSYFLKLSLDEKHKRYNGFYRIYGYMWCCNIPDEDFEIFKAAMSEVDALKETLEGDAFIQDKVNQINAELKEQGKSVRVLRVGAK